MIISATEQAAAQIKVAAQQSNAEDLALRIEIEVKDDGSFHYLMGFDDNQQVGDLAIESNGIKLVVGRDSQQNANGLILDYIDLTGRMEFVFLNPNDPHYKPPQA